MDHFKIIGGKPLRGSVSVSGAKNAITKMLVGSILSDRKCTFTNVPNISEVEATAELCEQIGMQVMWAKGEGRMEVLTQEIKSMSVSCNASATSRIPIVLLAPLLGRTKSDVIVPTVGGCSIGQRPVDFHIMVLERLGAVVERVKIDNQSAYVARAPNGLKGCTIDLPYPSVTATETAILAACRAQGETIIHGAAIEPEIIELIVFLQKLGVAVRHDGDRTICVRETTTFHEVKHRVVNDRVEAACYGMAAVATKGRVFVEGARQEHMTAFLNRLREINGGFCVKEDGIEFFYQGPLEGGISLETGVHPGFLTDWQPPFVVLLTQANGSSVVHETVYEDRFGYVDTLAAMGANIEPSARCLDGHDCRFVSRNCQHSVTATGPTAFEGRLIEVRDLRGGFACLMAALIAPDESVMTGLWHLDRGYENLEGKLRALGANIVRVQGQTKKGLLQ